MKVRKSVFTVGHTDINYMHFTSINETDFNNGRFLADTISGSPVYYPVSTSQMAYACNEFIEITEFKTDKAFRGHGGGKECMDKFLEQYRGVPVMLLASAIDLDGVENDCPDEMSDEEYNIWTSAQLKLISYYKRLGFVDATEILGTETNYELQRTMVCPNNVDYSKLHENSALLLIGDTKKIPYSFTVPFESYKLHKEFFNQQFEDSRCCYLMAWHTEEAQMVHWTPAETLPKIIDEGLKTSVMDENNDFGKTIHCFLADFPDNVFSKTKKMPEPVYFLARRGWAQCVKSDDVETPLRYICVPYDISAEEVQAYLIKTIVPLAPLETLDYFGFTEEEFKQRYKRAAALGNLIDLHTICLVINCDSDLNDKELESIVVRLGLSQTEIIEIFSDVCNEQEIDTLIATSVRERGKYQSSFFN